MIDPLSRTSSLRRRGRKASAPRTRRAFGVLLAVLFPLAAPISPARASFFDTFGASARGMALGNAMAAASEGWSSVYYNPAALALSRDIEFSVGVFSATPNIKTDFAQGSDQDLVQFPRRPASLDTLTGPAFRRLPRCGPGLSGRHAGPGAAYRNR